MASIGDKTVTHFTSDIKNVERLTGVVEQLFVNDQMLFGRALCMTFCNFATWTPTSEFSPCPRWIRPDRYYHTLRFGTHHDGGADHMPGGGQHLARA